MRRLLVLLSISLLAAIPARAQQAGPPPVDSVAVEGNVRLSADQIISTADILIGLPSNYRDIQRAIQALFTTNQFDDIVVEQRDLGGKYVLVFKVKERPILAGWSIMGADKISLGTVKDRVTLLDGRPIDRSAVERSRAAIDSMYRAQGYYAARVTVTETPQQENSVRVVFDIAEGARVAISEIGMQGNQEFSDKTLVKQMATQPEGFLWLQKGELNDAKLEADKRENLPKWYGEHGYIDMQVTGDTLVADSANGKAALEIQIEEGEKYYVGSFDIVGNRRFSTEDLSAYYPFGGTLAVGPTASTLPRQAFNRSAWIKATEDVQNLYANNGYIYSQIVPEESRHTLPDGTPTIDLRWTIREGQPATVNKIDIVGNDVTHERVIREAIVLLPGDVFSRDRLIRSYQNIGNLGFFQQPMPPPDVRPSANKVDVDIVFRVEEKRTGNINFGASVGQGTGVGGFIGLEEPNLFGRGKRGRLNWQFGRNINDFTLSYTDPAIKESRISGTLTLFNTRQRYTVGDLGRQQQAGGNIQFGLPFRGSRYTRLFLSYGYQRISYSGGAEDLRTRYNCTQCSRSTLTVSMVRDTRIDLPFPTGGTLYNVSVAQSGGPLGGTGDFQKIDLEGSWFAPLGTLGGRGQFGGGIRFVLGLTAKSGFIFGDAGPFYTELYSMGGVQFGVPLRGYDEFSITPYGYDPAAQSGRANPNAWGQAYAAFTVQAGARVSQQLYTNVFFDAGNVYREVRQYDPTRLFRGAGIGVAFISPLGPLGLDLAYGFDKVNIFGQPDPGWKVHFRLGNFF